MDAVHHHSTWIPQKSAELGLPQYMLQVSVDLLASNHHLVNALDHSSEMDDYIYQAILRGAFEKRKQKAEADMQSENYEIRQAAGRDLTVLSREELFSDPFYRAVLPLLMKVVHPGPILKLHAEEANNIIFMLADLKRKFRATSFTEVLVKRCGAELHTMALAS